jgi:hypothetical protein
MALRHGSRILLSVGWDPKHAEGGDQLPNPLAIGVTVGGLLLDIVAPRPKPRAGLSQEPSLLSTRAVSRTPRHVIAVEEYEGPPVASGYRS